MLRIGRMIKSAKMKASTPPKLMTPVHSTAAIGTLPIEQTKETIATSGPTSGPRDLAELGELAEGLALGGLEQRPARALDPAAGRGVRALVGVPLVTAHL